MEQQKKSRLITKYLLSCIVYTIISHFILGVSYQNLNILESSVRSFTIYSVMFSAYAVIPITISVLIAKVPKSNRSKSLIEYFNIGLVVAWIIALAALYFGWYGLQRIS